MKTFKFIDIIISIALIILFTVITIISPEKFFIGYFVVGGWQLISMSVHLVKKYFIARGTARFIYHRMTAWILGIAAVLGVVTLINIEIVGGVILCGLFLLLFAAPVMAVCYTVICYNEYVFLKKRAMMQLR